MQESNLSFQGLGIAPQLVETILKLKFKNATPIQHQAIPIALQGKDLMGIAQTGTGKTMAFGIPIIQQLAQNNNGRALVLVPTRELALQVEESILKLAHTFRIKTVSLIGGAPMDRQIQKLAQNPRVIIATPGRLMDLMRQRRVNLRDISIVVLDEADRMLDMGFAPAIEQILKTVPRERQTMLFSATMPGQIVKIASTYMKTPVQVEVAPPGTAAERVTHELFIVRREMKKELLRKILNQYRGSVLLFCRTKIGTFKTARSIREMGFSAAEIHSDRSLSQRRQALEGFKTGKFRILAATDIAARGIDVAGIEVVINYDLPDDAENYVHRIGRTGRAGLIGHAISFAAPDERRDVLNIEQLLKTTLPVSQHPDFPSEGFDKPKSIFSSSRFKSRNRGGFSGRRRR